MSVGHHFETSKMGHPFRPSCRLIFSKNAGNNFWIKPVCSLVLCHRSYLWHQLASISIFVRFYGSVKVEGNGTLSQDVLCGRSLDDEKDNQCEEWHGFLELTSVQQMNISFRSTHHGWISNAFDAGLRTAMKTTMGHFVIPCPFGKRLNPSLGWFSLMLIARG